jgi:segregation and condensation protein A
MSKDIDDQSPRKLICEPPLNLLFDRSILNKKNVWDIDVTNLLEVLLNIINNSEKKDLRICGLALLTSSIIHRLKVESIFALERIAMQRKQLSDSMSDYPIPELDSLKIPFRVQSFYPVSLEDLLNVLETLTHEIATSKSKSPEVRLEPIDALPDLDKYFLKFEEQLKICENIIMESLNEHNKCLTFTKLTLKKETIERVRFFIALLYLAMKNKIKLEQKQDMHECDIQISKIEKEN